MESHFNRLTTLLASMVALMLLLSFTWAQTAKPKKVTKAKSEKITRANSENVIITKPEKVLRSVRNDQSLPLREMIKIYIPPVPSEEKRLFPIKPYPYQDKILNLPPVLDPALQNFLGTNMSRTVLQSFDGIGLATGGGGWPSDQNGDVGPNHYVQMVNSSYVIFDKTGTTLLGPIANNTLWTGFGGPCETRNSGDPVVLYDQMADRWFLSQFAVATGATDQSICVACSQTPDPTGAYNRYQFNFGTDFPDYPKFGVWPDAYTATYRVFPNAGGFNEKAGALERAAMLAGTPAQMVVFSISDILAPIGADGFLPADLDGAAPAVTPPAPIIGHQDNGLTGAPADRLAMFELVPDWNNTANSTFTGPTLFPTDPYNPQLTEIPQPGTAQTLDVLAHFTMFRLQARDFGTHMSMVTNHTVDAGGRAGIRWYELRNTGGGWGINQQGTYSPDNDNRWMGSIAMDGAGNIALGYSVASGTTFPSIRFTGHTAGAAAGVMDVAEETIIAGNGSQTNTNRWGDYTAVTVDPTDDATFWYNNEYYTASGSSWQTRIASFKLGTGPPPSGILVWEGALGGQDYSGAFINNYLTNAGFTTTYTSVFPASLLGYDAVFLSFGNYGTDGSTSTVFNATMAGAVQAYLQAGGKVYLEGGDALGFDQAANTTLLNLFGLASAADGGTNVIDGLQGQAGSLADGMLFTASGQVNNAFIDIYTPAAGTVAFNESGYGDVAVQNNGSSFCFSYALSELTDAAAPSTKNDLMAAIVNYLGLAPPAPDPDIDVTPATLTFTVPVGGTDNGTLTIANTATAGAPDLTWTLTENPVSTWINETPTNGTVAAGANENVTVTVDATGLAVGAYNTNLDIASNDPDENPVTIPVTLNVTQPAQTDYLVWVHPSASGGATTSGTALFDALVANGQTATVSNDLFIFGNDLSILQGVFVVLGVFPNNGVLANASAEATALETYLANGGNLYLEGSDCFNYDPDNAGGHNIRPWFDLALGNDGEADIAGINGLNKLAAFQFTYSGENDFMDELSPMASTAIWQNNANTDTSGAFNTGFGGNAIAVVPEFGGLDDVVPLASKFEPGAGNVVDWMEFSGNKSKEQIRKEYRMKPVPVKTRYSYSRTPSIGIKSGSEVIRRYSDGQLEILANTKTDLMAAYLALWAPATGTDFSANLNVADNCANATNLTFGTAPDATFGYDPQYDQFAPPPPPPGAFDARFRAGAEDFFKDFRATNTGTIEWDIYSAPATGCDPVTLTWNSAEFPPEGSFRLTDAVGGIIVDLDMRTVNSYADVTPLGHLKIVYSLTSNATQNMTAGWNLIGLPLQVANSFYLSLYPSAINGTLFRFDGTYIAADSLDLGLGYWLRFAADETFTVAGSQVNSLNLNMMNGWNMISGPTCDVALADVTDPGNIIIPGTLFGFNGTYVLADSLKKGQGYWLRTNALGQITVACATTAVPGMAKQAMDFPDLLKYPSLQISDASGAAQKLHFNVGLDDSQNKLSFSMPPLPPAGAFDVRFAGDYRINETGEGSILIQSSNFPVTVSASQLPTVADYSYVLREIVGGKEIATHQLREGATVEISNPNVKMLKLSKERIVPVEFTVTQNYPNPFNPSTVIKYAVPNPERVEILIYNTLGQKVRTLVSGNKEAGYYEVVWDGSNDFGQRVGSGIYFYRVQAGENSAVKKMILMK